MFKRFQESPDKYYDPVIDRFINADGYSIGQALGIVKIARKYHASDQEIIHQLVDLLKIDEEKAREYLYKTDVA